MLLCFTSESDLRSSDSTYAVAKKAPKKILRFQRDSNPDMTYLRDAGAWLHQLSYEASLEAGQVRAQYEKNDIMCI